MGIEIRMNIKKGDKVIAKKQLKMLGIIFADVNDVFDVKDVFCNSVCIEMNDMNITIDNETFDEYFKKYEETKLIEENVEDEYSVPNKHFHNSITQEMIDEIIDESEIMVGTAFDKCTVVSCKLPNGFVITESSACVDPENYDEQIGIEICMNKIIDKVWELEGYLLQNDIYTAKKSKIDNDIYTIKKLKEELGLNSTLN